ncbi:MAG: P-type ATPase, partial [Thermodesulfovibrionales bacterium]
MMMPHDVAALDAFQGITHQEAEARLKEEGYNELLVARRGSVLETALEVVREPMFLLLVACGGLYLLLGDVREAIMLLSFVLVIMGITLFQERKTERALDALRDLSSPRALVIRGGVQVRIPGREVVRGDILVLSEGDRVPADAVILACTHLWVEESLLTGESLPVEKCASKAPAGMSRPGGEDGGCVYSGTLVVRGRGIAKVEATGQSTEIGRIGRALEGVELERT